MIDILLSGRGLAHTRWNLRGKDKIDQAPTALTVWGSGKQSGAVDGGVQVVSKDTILFWV